MNPRVLFLDHAGVLGGAELCLLDIAKDYRGSGKVLLFADGPFRELLERVGVTTEVLLASRAVGGISRNVNVIRDLQAVPQVLKLAQRVSRLARSYDVLYANSQKAFIIGALAGKLANKPVVWHLHDILTAEDFSRAHRWLAVNLANRMVARVLANSKASAAAFAESGGQTERVRVVYNGIDPAPFDAIRPTEVDVLREKLNPAKAPLIGVFGRLAPWKGQHVLLEALTNLPRVHALVVGEALFGEYAYRKALLDQAKALGVANRVRFLGFRLDIPGLMRLSDVVVHTSTWPEPFGRVIVEGMLAGKPVVATRAGATVEIIEDGVDGVLVPPGDAKALGRALVGLLANPARARALAEAGHLSALKRFSLQTMLESVAQNLQQVVTPHRR